MAALDAVSSSAVPYVPRQQDALLFSQLSSFGGYRRELDENVREEAGVVLVAAVLPCPEGEGHAWDWRDAERDLKTCGYSGVARKAAEASVRGVAKRWRRAKLRHSQGS